MKYSVKEILARFESFLDATISFDNGYGKLPDSPQLTMALLKRLIELADIHSNKKVPDGAIQLHDVPFLDFDFVKANRWRVLSKLPGSCRRPVDQHGMFFPLLMFLLVRSKDVKKKKHSEVGEPVFDLIARFIDEIKPNLSLTDFVRTKTGAMRCFTNTRFAARRLRELGMLKFTQREAFKTWELSITGIIVASTLYEPDWRKKLDLMDGWISQKALSARIREILLSLYSPEIFLKRLNQICTQAKASADAVLPAGDRDKTERLIRDYFIKMKMVTKAKVTADQREAISSIIDELDNVPLINRVIRSFKSSYSLNDFNSVMKSLFSTQS